MSLPQLQNIMKRDPEAYVAEFEQQWSHFDSMLEVFKLKPQKPQGTFSEQVMFLAHVSPSFPGKGPALAELLIRVLSEHFEIMHSTMRQTLVQALILLRNRDQFPCIRTLPLYFKLFSSQDKALRKMIFTHIVRDIVQGNHKSRNQQANAELRNFFFARLQETEVEVARHACAAFISLYRQNVWRDAIVVNLMSAGLLHPDVKLAAALAHLFLGNKTKGLEGILDESEDEDKGEADEAIKGIVGAKKTANREKRVKRAKKAAQKVTKRRKASSDTLGVNFVAIDLVHDPQMLADRLLSRLSKGGEPFLFRLLVLHLVARLVGRHQLQLLNFYPFILKYLVPTQQEVTKVLACLVEASHTQVPPDEVRPVVLHIMKSFVTEAQAPEVIEVGLNAIREICGRCVGILKEEELEDLCGFRKFKNKGVAMAARSLINAYREIDPQLLHRSLRGREATMALSRGEVDAPLFGSTQAVETIDGLELLTGSTRVKGSSKADPARAEAEAKASAEAGAKKLMTEEVLNTEQFKQLRKLRLQRSIQRQLGRKRRHQELSSSGSESDSDVQESDGERGMTGRLPGGISADALKASAKKGRTKAERLAKVAAGRTDYKKKLLEQRKSRKGGRTNAEQKRNKPQMMAMRSGEVRRKLAHTAKQKIKTLKTHIKTLRKSANHQKRRR